MSLQFTPAPRNDFADFIRTYFERCRDRAPRIEGNAGKWRFEDLIPGLSDFDTRFLVSDATTAEDWCRISMGVAAVHLELALERKDWARNLEHLPGVNLKWGELLDPAQYFTEFSQWSFYHGDPLRLAAARRFVSEHAWSPADEAYHWKKISLYYGPYNRTIDPAINLGPYANKYSLHSRLLHYFCPPVHAGVCLAEGRTSAGKIDAFRRARALFPRPAVIERVLALIGRHYEDETCLTEPGMTELDAQLEGYLEDMVAVLLERRPLPCPARPSVSELKRAVAAGGGAAPLNQLFENIKFSRLMKGRLWFYGQEVAWFESGPLIRNELNRIGASFYATPLRLFARLAYGVDVTPEAALARMEGDVLDAGQAAACRRFAADACAPCPDGELRARALKIAAGFDAFLHALEHLLVVAKLRWERPGHDLPKP